MQKHRGLFFEEGGRGEEGGGGKVLGGRVGCLEDMGIERGLVCVVYNKRGGNRGGRIWLASKHSLGK